MELSDTICRYSEMDGGWRLVSAPETGPVTTVFGRSSEQPDWLKAVLAVAHLCDTPPYKFGDQYKVLWFRMCNGEFKEFLNETND